MVSWSWRTVALFGSSLFLVFSLTAAHRECGFNDTDLEPDGRNPHETNPHYVWKDGKIPYVFTSSVGEWDKKVFRNNMAEIKAHSCFRFKELSRPPPRSTKYLEIDVGSESCANGRFSAHVTNKYLARGTKNALLLFSQYKLADEESCRRPERKGMYEGGILHEMFHALGIAHTQKRPDRNTYIQVFPNNIQAPRQYEPCRECKLYPQVPYECNSIMHYGYKTFLKPGHGRTMESRRSDCTITAWGSDIATNNDWRLVKIIGDKTCSSGSGGGSTSRWGPWENRGYCSVTCGTGMQKQTRSCQGGTRCNGDSERYFACKQPDCAGGACSRDNPCGVGRSCFGDSWNCNSGLYCGCDSDKDSCPTNQQTCRPQKKEKRKCKRNRPCPMGAGDCDSDSECFGDLECGNANCGWKSGWFIKTWDDCCIKP